MNVKVVYPAKNIRHDIRRAAIYWAKPAFILAAIISAVVNILVKGSAWSVIVIWSLWMIWSFVFTPTLIEHNRTSIAVKSSIHVTILIVIIYMIYPSWPGIEVASLVVVGGLIITAILFFSNVSRQKQNVFPLLIFIIIAIIFSPTITSTIIQFPSINGMFHINIQTIIVCFLIGQTFISLIFCCILNII